MNTGKTETQRSIISGIFFLLLFTLVITAVSAADASTGTLVIQSTPSGASVSVDGTVAGTTPFTSSTVAAGDRTVTLSLAGYETYTTTVTVPAGGSVTGNYILVAILPVTTTLADTGTMTIRSTPSGASVYVDGTLKGTTPYTDSGVAAGDHSIRLTMEGYGDFPSTVTIPAGGIFQEIYTMPVNILTIGSDPSGASLYLDGTLEGTTPRTFQPVRAGTHTVVLKLNGYRDLSTTVTVTGGMEVTREYTMNVATTATTASTTPAVVAATTVTTASTTVAATTAPTTAPSVTETTQYTIVKPATCTRRYTGTGRLEAIADGGLNCTTILTTDDSVATILIRKGTVVTGTGKRMVSEIGVVPVNASVALPESPGHAYRFQPEETSFSQAFVVNFTLSQTEWDAQDPRSLIIRQSTANGTGWEDLQTIAYAATRTLSATSGRFSTIGLFSTSPAAGPVVPTQQVPEVTPAAKPARGSLPLSPIIPDQYAPLAAVGAGIAVCLAGTLVSGSTALSGLWSKISALAEKFLGSETIGLFSSTEIEKRGLRPAENLTALVFSLSPREFCVIGFSTLGFAIAFILQDRLALVLTTIIIYVCMGGIATILHDLAHKYCAYRAGCITEYQVWGLGSVTMLSTAWLFGNAFAKPSRTLIRSEKELTHEESAIIKMAGPLMSMAVAVLSLFLIPLGGLFATAGEAGFSMNLLNAVFSLVPVKPNDGVEVYAWNRRVWAMVFIPLIAFYLYIYLQT